MADSPVVHSKQPLTEELFAATSTWIALEDRGHVTKCHVWQGGENGRGYGKLRDPIGKRKTVLAHRMAYQATFGPVADGLQIDHLCRVRLCVNPDHLEAVSAQENCKRAKAGITHCPQGHPYQGENLIITSVGSRKCRSCDRQTSRQQYLARKAARCDR